MYFATNNNMTVFAKDAAKWKDVKKAKFTCPACGKSLYLCSSSTKTPYFRHSAGKSDASVACKYKDNSKSSLWLQSWYSVFDVDKQNKALDISIAQHYVKRHSYIWCFNADTTKRLKRRQMTDFLDGNVVVQFVSEPMEPEEFSFRTWIYNMNNKYVVWVFNIEGETTYPLGIHLPTRKDQSPSIKWHWEDAWNTFAYASPAIEKLKPNFEVWFCTRSWVSAEDNITLKDAIMYQVVNCAEQRTANGSKGFRVPIVKTPVEVHSDMSTFYTGDAVHLLEFKGRVEELVKGIPEDHYRYMNFVD